MTKWRVRFAPWSPYTELKTSDNITRVGGIAGDIYESLQSTIKFNYEVELQPYFIYGRKLPGNTWSGMVGAMINNETDISGPYLMNEERGNIMQFANPLAFCQLGIVSGMESTMKSTFLLLEIFSWQIWLALTTTVIVASSAASMIFFVLPSILKRGITDTFLKYVWTFQTALLGIDFGSNQRWFLRHVRSSTSFRIIQGIWCTAGCIVLMNTYQGTIVSTFAVDKLKLKLKIETMEDLLSDTRIEIGTFKNSYPEACFANLKETKYESLWLRIQKNLIMPPAQGTVLPWLEQVEEGKIVMVAEILWMKSFVGNRFLHTGKCNIRVTPIDFCAAYKAIAVRRQFANTPFLMDFNRSIRRFDEARLSHPRFINSTLYYGICSGDTGSVVDPLKLNDVLGAFIIFAIGIWIPTVIFIIEIISCKRSCRKCR